MNIHEFMKESSRTCPDLKGHFYDELHMAIGAATETGELLDVYKKTFAYGKILDRINVGEEIGDAFWYLVNLCRMLELDPEQLMDACINKLRIRYPENFIQEKALNRDFDAERNSLEKNIT